MFTPIKLAVKKQVKKFLQMTSTEMPAAICLEEIITAQVDEPHQKNCVYRVPSLTSEKGKKARNRTKKKGEKRKKRGARESKEAKGSAG